MDAPQAGWGEQALAELFGSDVRAGVLSWVCAHGDDLIVGAQLARKLGMSPSAVGTELARLERLGMLEATDPIGPAKPYRVNESFPLLQGLRSVCMYATGVVAALRAAFADEEGIEVAFVFGSLARGDDRPDSDVDVIVVGDIPGIDLAQLTRPVWLATGREINWIDYSSQEFAEKAGDDGEFLSRVLADQRILLKGDDDAIQRLAEPAEDPAESVVAV